MNDLYTKLGISQKHLNLSKQQPRVKFHNAIDNNIVLEPDINYMADILMLPTTKQDYKFLLVVVDLATRNFDIEPMKRKDANSTLQAYKEMLKRPYINLPTSKMATDDGNEFKGVFNQFLQSNDVYHKVSLPNRHKQTSIVENLNKTLSKILMMYIVGIEERTKKIFNEWTDIIDEVREYLNKHMERDLKKVQEEQDKHVFDITAPQNYEVGDYVYIKLDHMEDALKKKQPTTQRRMADYTFSRDARRVMKVLCMNDKPYYRYIVDGINKASFSDDELQRVPKSEMRIIEKVVRATKIINKYHTLVIFKGETKPEMIDGDTIMKDKYLMWQAL